MKISNKLKILGLSVVILISFSTLTQATFAAPAPDAGGSSSSSSSSSSAANDQAGSAATQKSTALNNSLQKNPIVRDLRDWVNFLAAGVGIVVVAMIMLGGIQYSIAGDSPQKVTDAKKRIVNALIALIAFMFIYAFVQWLIPGGLFG